MGRDQLFARSCTEIQAIVHGKKLQHVQLELFSISYPAAKATTYAPVPLKAEAQSWSVGRFPEGSAEMLHVKSGTNVYTRHDAESEPRLSQETYKTMQNQIMRRHGSAITNRILQTSYHNVLYDLDPIINHDERGTCRYIISCKKTLHQFVQVAQKHATAISSLWPFDRELRADQRCRDHSSLRHGLHRLLLHGWCGRCRHADAGPSSHSVTLTQTPRNSCASKDA